MTQRSEGGRGTWPPLAPQQPRGRHRGRDRLGGGRRARTAVWAAASALALTLAMSVYAFAENLGIGAGCRGPDALTIDVAAAPRIAVPLTAAAGGFNDASHRMDGRCVRAQVRRTDPVLTSALLAGRMPESERDRRPDVWVPDSSLWLQRQDRPPAGTLGSIARSPLVVATGKAQRAKAASWEKLFGGTRLSVPDPGRTATGMTTLMLARTLLGDAENADIEFAGLVPSIRQRIVPDITTRLTSLSAAEAKAEPPVVAVPEQAVWSYNRKNGDRKDGEPAVAVYPGEGTLSLDFPYAVVPDGAPERATRLLYEHLRGEAAQEAIRQAGLRDVDGTGPPSFGPETGVRTREPRALPAPEPERVRMVAQAWARLSLGSRMLSMIDISGSMATRVPGTDLTRLQAITGVSQEGLALQPDESELGQWVFATELEGSRDWRENVSLGPLGERIGSSTRRQLILSALAQLRPVPNGDTGLYDSLLAAFEHMTESYKPEMISTVLVLTDGRNDDPGGPSLKRTLARLRAAHDPERPVQVIMIGFGSGVDTDALGQIAEVTGGSVHVAHEVGDIHRIFRVAMARRLCAPDC